MQSFPEMILCDGLYNLIMHRQNLRRAYTLKVSQRDALVPDAWKIEQRAAFLALLQEQDCQNLLEIGSGPGQDAAFFADQNIDVVATDLTPANAIACAQKGLKALAGDATHQAFGAQSFDAAYSLNCLLHVPKSEWPLALKEIQRVLKTNGLFYLTVWGGIDQEGIYAEDSYTPKRFFAFHTDEALQSLISRYFKIENFTRIQGSDPQLHAQSFLLHNKES